MNIHSREKFSKYIFYSFIFLFICSLVISFIGIGALGGSSIDGNIVKSLLMIHLAIMAIITVNSVGRTIILVIRPRKILTRYEALGLIPACIFLIYLYDFITML